MTETLDSSESPGNWNRTLFCWALNLIALTLPLSTQANGIAIGLLILSWVAGVGGVLTKLQKLLKAKGALGLVFFYLLHLLGLIYTANFNEGIFQLEKKLTFLILPLILLTSEPLSRSEFKIIMNCLLISVFSASFICLGYAIHRNNYLDTFSHPVWFYFSYGDLTDIIGMQPNYLALFVGFSIIILLTDLPTAHRKGHYVLHLLGIGYLFIFLLLLATRTPLFATLFIVVAAWLYSYYQQKKLLKGIGLLIIFLFLTGLVTFQVPIIRERIFQTFGIKQQTEWINQWGDGTGGLISDRTIKWKSAWNEIKKNMILGVGPGDVQDALDEEYTKAHYGYGLTEHLNAHNQYLQTWVGLGLVGLVGLLFCLAWPAYQAIKVGDFLYFSCVSLFGLCCITESMLERQWGIIFFATFFSIFFNRYAVPIKKDVG